MPQFEPKIDSKEFEVLNAGQESVPLADAVKDSTDLTIRLWHPEGATAGRSVTWKTESVLVYMIADLVAASRGRVDESSPSITAHFDSTSQALVAAKRVQTSILEFLTCRPDDSFVAALLIHQPPTTPGGFTPGMTEEALRLAEPGQILLSAETGRRLHDLPGIQLRNVPRLTAGGDEVAGLTELIWTSPERMEQFKAKVHGAPSLEQNHSLGATMIVNAPLASPTGRMAQSIGTTGLVGPHKAAITEVEQVGTGSIPRFDVARPEDSLEHRLIEPEEPSFPTRTTWMIGLAAVVLIGVLVWAFYPSSASKVPPSGQASRVGGSEGPTAPQTTVSQPPTQQPMIEPPAKPPVIAAQPTAPTQLPKQKRVKEKVPAVVPPQAAPSEEQQPIQGFEGMSQKDIPYLLQMARTDAGSGKYERAKKEYQVVLRIQPNNADAKEGLRRLEIATQSDQ